MKTSVYIFAGLLIGCSTLVAAAYAAESYEITNCGASTVTTISASQELTVLSIDTKGIVRSDAANKAFDNETYHCAAVVTVAGGQWNGRGYCKFMDPDGDFLVGETTPDSPGGGKWKFLQGMGKWKGITGSGQYVSLTRGKPIVEGTNQGCVKATGTYDISK